MSVSANQIQLDDDALSLYEQLDGIHTEYQNNNTDQLSEEEKGLDALRLDMMDTAHSISAWFLDMRFSDGIRKQKDLFSDILKQLEKLAKIPGHDGGLMIRYRGYPTGTAIAAENDYVISFGNLSADASTAAALKSRMGTDMFHLPARLGKAFQTLSEYGISHMYLKIPRTDGAFPPELTEQFRDSLHIISQFNRSLKTNSAIVFEKKGRKTLIPLICDEKGAGDFNLTLLSGLNNIKPQTMQMLVRKSAEWMKEADVLQKNNPYISIYDAIIQAANLKDRFIIPPVEVNNLKWLCLDETQTRMSGEQARLSRMAASYTDSPRNTAQVIEAVYGRDYKEISAGHLGQRLRQTTDFLGAVQEKSANPAMEKEVLRNISERFEEIRDEVFEDLIIQKDILKIRSQQAEPETVGKINAKLRNIIEYYKGRAAASKKVKNIIRNKIDFDVQDYETLAADFGISAPDIKHLISLLRRCFSEEGHFLRSVFERHIPDFVRYEKKIFRFLWHYLKETPERNDRVAFLNSLQGLTARMQEPQEALNMLLADLLDNPDNVSFSDRNALILSNLLIRDSYRELTVDIEMTPEEVLMNRNGLNRRVSRQAIKIVRTRQEDIFRKIRAINRELVRLAASGDKEEMSVRFLLSLERELHIFLILTGGETALKVLRNAAGRYGDPGADIYLAPKIREKMESVIQHLTIVVRGLERLGSRPDNVFLRQIRQAEGAFLALSADPLCIAKIRRMMHWVENAGRSIAKRKQYDWEAVFTAA